MASAAVCSRTGRHHAGGGRKAVASRMFYPSLSFFVTNGDSRLDGGMAKPTVPPVHEHGSWISSLWLVAKRAFGVSFLATMSFAMLLVWVYNFSSGASPGVTAFRDSLDSCVGVGLAYNGMHSMPFFRGIACSDLVNAAALRGKAGFDKGNETRYLHMRTGEDISSTSSGSEVGSGLEANLGAAENPEKDGCRVVYDSDVDPRDIKPTSSFTHSGCQIEWITFSTRCGKGVQRLAKFCDLVGVPFAVLGLNETWKGLGGRVRYYREYLRTLPRDRIVIVTDADDVLFLPNRELCGPDQLVKAFLSLNAPVVFGAEIFAYPTVDVIPFYSQKLKYPFPNRHLNAGSYVGYAWALSEMIDATYTSDCMEDQRQFVTGYLAQPYLFNSLPRTPYPETNFTSIQSLLSHQAALATSLEAAPRANRKLQISSSTVIPTPGTLKYLCALPGPLQDLIPEDVTPEKLEAARQAAPPPFIKLDHYNALMELLGGRRFEQYEVQGSGTETKVYSRVTKSFPCIFHQSGDKLKRGVVNEIVENGTLDAIAFG